MDPLSSRRGVMAETWVQGARVCQSLWLGTQADESLVGEGGRQHVHGQSDDYQYMPQTQQKWSDYYDKGRTADRNRRTVSR